MEIPIHENTNINLAPKDVTFFGFSIFWLHFFFQQRTYYMTKPQWTYLYQIT